MSYYNVKEPKKLVSIFGAWNSDGDDNVALLVDWNENRRLFFNFFSMGTIDWSFFWNFYFII